MNLIEGLSREIQRVSEMIHHYEELGPPGVFGLSMIASSLESAHVAIGSGDIAEMAQALNRLKGHTG